ncbi:hypothetical protein LO772_00425 [Yinghuangia sp. ASG 101]|uniref:hypothetical protein n=1 Tax=Yinghuangia sp. ASG 101 TaxID=2896848 RepID=UPI001E3EFEC3|nr:hypothetical protein [Yinghuangia sp. ASG 101]UGQ12114.1 hypothetical protein LO772_00425 [Yinghuangia sp. ASG 101]
MTGWSGELVSTLFIRCALMADRKTLFVEGSCSLLTPVRERYRIADRLLDSPTFRQWWSLVGLAGLRSPGLMLRAPSSVSERVLSALTDRRKQRRQAREIRHRTFNYGASFSIRDAASDRSYHRYFQQLDRELYAKTVEHRVLDALAEFLDDHNIDSNELVQRQSTIYNTGLYVGGNVSLRGSALGVGGSFARVFQRGSSGDAPTAPASVGPQAPPVRRTPNRR